MFNRGGRDKPSWLQGTALLDVVVDVIVVDGERENTMERETVGEKT